MKYPMILCMIFLLYSNTTKSEAQKNNLFFTKKYKTSKASWYGPGFNGRKTASGEIYNQDSLTCASPNLPFGTELEVINIANNKKVVVRVNDRGPFAVHSNGKPVRPLKPHPTRALDLSKKAFSTIANTKKGVINIKYKILE